MTRGPVARGLGAAFLAAWVGAASPAVAGPTPEPPAPAVAGHTPEPPGTAVAGHAPEPPAPAVAGHTPEAAPPARPPADDGDRPTGRPFAARERPDAAAVPVVACSFEEDVCVRAAASIPGGAVLATLGQAERALRGYRALGLPPPLPRPGGSPAYDIYVLPGGDGPLTVSDPTPSADGWDRASAFTVLPPPSPRAGCAGGFAVAQALAHAVALRFDAGAEEGVLAMTSSYLASLVAPCATVELAAVDDFQRHPQRSFAAGDADRPDGAFLFPAYLDEAYGRGTPGRVMTSFLALATQKTPPGSWEWRNEPDVFDVLRATMRDRGTQLDQLLLDFAVSRAFVGTRSDGAHLADVERFGDFGRVRFEWSIPYETLPRRLAPRVPIEATGMTYLWLDTRAAPPGAELTFVADWELPAVFRWALVKVDKSGAESGRLDVAGLYGESHAERTLVNVDGLAGVMVVGVNAGSMDRGHPFDPDEQPGMPHGYTVTLVK
jgi:hypothetical protein